MVDKVSNWLKIAKYDLKSAADSHKCQNYLTCIEKCHNSLEKILKAMIASHHEVPAKIHALLKLSSEAVIENLQKDIQKFFDELDTLYMNTRYPDDFEILEASIDEGESARILKETKRVFAWLEKKIK
ncbi:MAG: HEPN domain-containing protein [Candidatus Melainabacteria bacterium]|nr:HEPN domain-containing protein [Candidatus Melainabacteria bacterium]